MEFSRQEYWSGLPFPSPGNLPDPGIEPRSPLLQTDALLSELPGKPIYTYKIDYDIKRLSGIHNLMKQDLTPSSHYFILSHSCFLW